MQGDEARPFSPTVFPVQPVPEGFNRGAGIHKPFSSPTQTILAAGRSPTWHPPMMEHFIFSGARRLGDTELEIGLTSPPDKAPMGQKATNGQAQARSGFEMGKSGYNLYNETREIS